MDGSIGQRIREARKHTGLSQDEFGDKINVTRQTISKWELGESAPKSDNLRKIQEVFGFSASFFFGDGDLYEDKPDVEELERASESAIADGANKQAPPGRTFKILSNILLITAIAVLTFLFAVFVIIFISFVLPLGKDDTHMIIQVNGNSMVPIFIIIGIIVLCIILIILIFMLIKSNKR